MVPKTIQFLAVTLTALALVPSGAHLLALPNKIGLLRDAYYVAQGGYHGWALLGAVVIGALLADAALAVLVHTWPVPFRFAILGSVEVAATLAIYPAKS